MKLVEEIVTEAGKQSVNQVKFYGLLTKAGIKNVDADRIQDYADDIKNASTTPIWSSDVQKIVDQTNKDAGDAADEATIVKAVADATNQIQLLPVLEANFDRVNADWIADYADEAVDPTGVNTAILDLDADNYAGKTAAVTKAQIQATIDKVNGDNIVTADGDADTATKQAAVTSLVEKYIQADVAPSTGKADVIKASKAKEAAYRVAEATTENTLYNALVAYANATTDANLKASELNANLKSYYKAAIDAAAGQSTVRADLKVDIKADDIGTILGNNGVLTNAIETDIVQEANGNSLADALDDVGAKATTYDGTKNDTNKAAFVKALQKLADYTSHYTEDDEKFLMSTIDNELLEGYAADLAGIDSSDDVDTVQQAIKDVNDEKGLFVATKVIADAKSTTVQVRDALVNLAIADPNDTTNAYVNASSQIKLEVAQFIVDQPF